MFGCRIALLLILVCLAASATVNVSVPLRFQWNENNGYCGECCIIASGLSLGQYVSQYDARVIADEFRPTSSPQTRTQFLLGVNDVFTAKELRLQSVEWDHKTKDTSAFLGWVKQMVSKGYTVTIGLYMNYYLFYSTTDANAGDADYDHIVSVTRVDSQYPNDGLYHDEDILYISDNGLWAPVLTGPPYIFSATFKDFQGNRKDANAKTGAVYTVPNDRQIGNYGLAISGVLDDNGDTVPIAVNTNVNYETPEIDPRSNTRPKSMPLTLTGTASGLLPAVSYNLYKYSDETAVPTKQFNDNAVKASKVWKSITSNSGSYSWSESITSSDKVFYRMVRADAA